MYNHPRIPLEVSDDKFLGTGKEMSSRAYGIILDHASLGENETFTISRMFPHGIQDIVYEIFKKACRAVGYEMQGNFIKAFEELQDIHNYSIFALAYMKLSDEVPQE